MGGTSNTRQAPAKRMITARRMTTAADTGDRLFIKVPKNLQVTREIWPKCRLDCDPNMFAGRFQKSPPRKKTGKR